MIAALLILLLTLLQLWAGFGCLRLFTIELKPVPCLSLSLLIGVGVYSLVPFLLQLFCIPLTPLTVAVSLVVAGLALNSRLPTSLAFLQQQAKKIRLLTKMYELPFLALLAFLVFVSVWRCFYFPPTPRDLTSGPEVIAEYAVKEKTMINSVFTVNLETTNNQFKPAYITSLQIIYKLAGFPFGQLWLSTVFIAFVVFLYSILRQRLHPVFAGFLLVAFVAIPEMYAYTFMALFDYSNAVFFGLAVYFFVRYFENQQRKWLQFAAFLMGLATYIRSETLVLAGFLTVALFAGLLRRKEQRWTTWISPFLFLLPSCLVYLLSVTIYIRYYLPVTYPVENLVNHHLLNLHPFFERFQKVNTELIFSKYGVELYGYFVFLFLLLLVLDTCFHRKLSVARRNLLFAVAVVYLGIPFLGYLLPLIDLENSSKRALFKLFPLMLLYMSSSPTLVTLSNRLADWEREN